MLWRYSSITTSFMFVFLKKSCTSVSLEVPVIFKKKTVMLWLFKDTVYFTKSSVIALKLCFYSYWCDSKAESGDITERRAVLLFQRLTQSVYYPNIKEFVFSICLLFFLFLIFKLQALQVTELDFKATTTPFKPVPSWMWKCNENLEHKKATR